MTPTPFKLTEALYFVDCVQPFKKNVKVKVMAYNYTVIAYSY